MITLTISRQRIGGVTKKRINPNGLTHGRFVGRRPTFRFQSYDSNSFAEKTKPARRCLRNAARMVASTHSMTPAGTVYDTVPSGCSVPPLKLA